MRGFGSNGSRSWKDQRTIFFATDLHGSEVCFRKFVNAAAFYDADVLILGGDLTGKFVVPIVDQGEGRFEVQINEQRQTADAHSVASLERRLADQGLYPCRMTPAERARFEDDPTAVEALFEKLMAERLKRWIDLAKAKLEATPIRILCAPGNDDPFAIDALIRECGDDRVLLLEGEIYEVAPGHELLSTGYSNPTPWHTHRELSEEELERRIDELAARLERPSTAIFNIHVPPYDSGLDSAPSLDEELTTRTAAGAQVLAPAGSLAVRSALERYQPLLSLHGHIHESGGATRIGRTVALNPGSEYAEGVLRGVLVTVGGGELIRYQATTG